MKNITKNITTTLLLTLASLYPLVPAQAGPESAAGHAEFKTCRARWTETELVLGNSHFERVWRIKDGLLTAVSFRDLDAKIEWLAGPAKQPAPLPEGKLAGGKRALAVTTRRGQLSPVEEESLVVEMKSDGTPALAYRFQVFPAAHGVQVQFKSDVPAAAGKPAEASAKPEASTGVETNPANADGKSAGDSLEDLMLAPQHLRFTQVTLRDQTDDHNELVFENEWLLSPNEKPLRLPGNIFFVEDTLTGAGLLFLKQAPLPHARPVKSEWDADMSASSRRLRFSGQGYPFVLLAYSGGRSGRIEALQTYQRQLRKYDSQRDAMFLSNTWGDRSRDARINEAFMLKEIDAGARLGVDVVQIDDGWQKGRTANSAFGQGVWNGYWASDPEFWKPHPQRFPHGLAPLVAAAREQHMKFGLWFGPDSSREAANWDRDAGLILDLHKNGGIDYIKIDSVKAVTPGAEANLRKFYDRVLQESAGKVVFDIDATAEIRPTYFGIPDVGPIFVENRYSDWHRYWPHLTLRNLWKLSQYVDPLRLRMEFLNNSRSTNQYSKDPLAPAQYSPDALFATVMFANPLGWFETSNLPENYIQSVSRLVAVWKRERSRLFSGHTLPIGSAPDGVSWTGFASVAENRRSGYLLLFRELNEQSEWSVDLSPFSKGTTRVAVLAGNGTAKLTGEKLTVSIPKPLQYLWVKFSSERSNTDEAMVGDYVLPELLKCGNGQVVTNVDMWRNMRRGEILEAFSSQVYGRTPKLPVHLRAEVTATCTNAVGGLATRTLVTLHLFDDPAAPKIHLMLYVPNGVRKPVPVFLGLNYFGLASLEADPALPLSGQWVLDDKTKGVVNHRATEATRGSHAARWSLELALRRGYGVATYFYGDLEEDNADGWRTGLRGYLRKQAGRTDALPDEWGALGVWAWGLSRAMDYLAINPAVDPKGVVVFGHSRHGKAALWAGVQDERFAAVISNNSGEGGAALARRDFGETIADMVRNLNWWVCDNYRRYAGHADDLPTDQHMLLALCAPRPLYVASATEDLWSDPRGEFLSAVHAAPAYRLFGLEGLGASEMPPPDRPIGQRIGYHLRTGKHDITAYDWEQYLNFADRQLKVSAKVSP